MIRPLNLAISPTYDLDGLDLDLSDMSTTFPPHRLKKETKIGVGG